MIYEMRTYTTPPNQAGKFLEIYGDAYETYRKKFSEMAGCWYTEIGPLNQVITIWPYKNLAERDKIRAAASKEEGWPPHLGQLTTGGTVEVFAPFSFSPLLEPGNHGPIYEMRSYQVVPGTYDDLIAGWEKGLPERTSRSPISVLMLSDLGVSHKLVHIWPYQTFDQRAEVRGNAVADKIWPPSIIHVPKQPTLTTQENLIMLPAKFSPMQ